MNRVALQNLWRHKRRLFGTMVAVVLGVAFLSGTLVLGDTLRANFTSLFTDVTAGTDVAVRGTTLIEGVQGTRAQRQLIDQSLLDSIRSVDGVRAAVVTVQGYGQLIGKDGKAIGGNGPPRLAGNWVDDPSLSPYALVEGRAPARDGEVVINKGAATSGQLHVGDETTVQTPEPVPVTVVGIATFAGSDGFGTATFTAFTLDAAQQHVTKRPGLVGTVLVAADPGVSQAQLVQRLQAVLPAGTEAITGAAFTDATLQETTGGFLGPFTTLLLVFALVALLVSTFSINNTFSILLAQRTRELALLRSLGADRRQVLGSVVLETVVIGLVASAVGVVGGLGFAGLLKGVFDAFGFALPASGLVVQPTALLVAFVVGLTVTVASGVVPALRASRVAPLAALRETAIDRSQVSRTRRRFGPALAAGGVVVVALGLGVGGDRQLLLVGLGAALTLVSLVVLGPVVAPAAVRFIGWPMAHGRAVSGLLARENSIRNPRRTSGSAAALMVGVGVVVLFTVFAASLKHTIDDSVSRSFGGDLVVSSPGFGGGALSPQLAGDIAAVPEVADAVGLGIGAVRINGSTQAATVTDPASLQAVLDIDVVDGSLSGLGPDQLAASHDTATANGWSVGSQVPVTFVDGSTEVLTIGGIYQQDDVIRSLVVPRSVWAPHAVQSRDNAVLIKLHDSADLSAGRAAVEAVAQRYGGPEVQDRQQYIASVTRGIDLLLGIVYVMLALAVVIALMGIANTLALSMYERTRELGLLRAIGQTRRQLRTMVRYESVLIAAFGTVGGLLLGTFLGWALVRASGSSFSVPAGSLAIIGVAGAVAGIIAAVLPARRAARLDILPAIAAD